MFIVIFSLQSRNHFAAKLARASVFTHQSKPTTQGLKNIREGVVTAALYADADDTAPTAPQQ